MLHLWSSSKYAIELPDGHRFPMSKYQLLREGVLSEGLVPPERLHDPQRVRVDDLLLVHTREYVDHITNGTLPAAEQRRIGLPWSESFVERAYRVVQGTCEAAESALTHGVAMNLAGGTHHAFPDRGEGFCTFNDVAVAIRRLQRDGRVRRVAIVDLDVHQGNGTAAIFEGDASVFTFSVHGERNYPARKMRSSLDVGLPDGTDDATYLQVLQEQLPNTLQDFVPDLVFYLAGVDVAEGDRYGRFRLTEQGIRERERTILDWARRQGLPLVVTLAGGYSPNALRTAILHCIVFEEAAT